MERYRIIPLKCGYIVNHERAAWVYRKQYDGERFNAPCIAWLLKSEERTIIVDTGPGSKSSAPQFYTKDESSSYLLQDELKRCGTDPATISTVILTHLHNDHVGGVALFPNAEFYVQEAELKEAVWPVTFQRPIYEVNQRGKIPSWTYILHRMQVLYGDSDLFPGISVITLPGHTAGSQGVLVNTRNGCYVIAGDLVPLYDNWPGDGRPPIPNGNHTDLRAYDKSFLRLSQLNARILPGHDARVFDYQEYPN
jgi:glyoxylase-like metal-dependent hydrolase (beta-lactamase superfamily II)